MPVNLAPPLPNELHAIAGLRLGVAEANIRKPGRKDVLLIELAAGSTVVASFTQNRFCAAPVLVCRQHLATATPIRAMLVNTGCANAGTSEEGIIRAQATCTAVANALNIASTAVLPFSTGVILEHLPHEKIIAALDLAVRDLKPDNWFNAAQAIMTTDLVPKAISRQITLGEEVITITGIAKGSGMIHPNMATMLAYIATDAAVSEPMLALLLRDVVEESFNSISVDGDTSTNDACVLVATGQANNHPIYSENPDYMALKAAISDVAIALAQAIVRDGEGASKFITVRVEGGYNKQECRAVATAIVRSPLIKTAFFASDPNLGRILAAIGYAEVKNLDITQLQLYLDDLLVAEHGGRATSYQESAGQVIMSKPEIMVRVLLNRGSASITMWTCDLSYDYIKINAEYRS